MKEKIQGDSHTKSISTYIYSFLALVSLLAFLSLFTEQVKQLIFYRVEYHLNIHIPIRDWPKYLFLPRIFLLLITIYTILISIPVENLEDYQFYRMLKKNISTYKWISSTLITLIWGGLILVFLDGNLRNPNFWFDESGQFWMAKGLNHFSLPFSASRSINDVLQNNALFNLDPGGFTVILHYWTMISNQPFFLRSLPFLFFIASMLVVNKIFKGIYPDAMVSYFSGLILLTTPLLRNLSYELRPYSMELLATILSLFFSIELPTILNSRKFSILSGISLAILLTSRYSAIISISIFCVFATYQVYINRHETSQVINSLYIITPIILSGLLIVIYSLRYQWEGTPKYVSSYMIRSGNFRDILFNPAAIVTYGPFIALFIIFALSKRKNSQQQLKKYILFTLFVNCCFAISSYCGLYPWAFNTKWDISSHSLLVLSIIPLIIVFSKSISKKTPTPRITELFITLVTLSFFLFCSIFYDFQPKDFVYSNLIDCPPSNEAPILANINATPTIRYLFEYGPLKANKEIYQNISWFNDTGRKVPIQTVDLDSINQYEYIILTHYPFKGSKIEKLTNQGDQWELCSFNKPSYMFKRVSGK